MKTRLLPKPRLVPLFSRRIRVRGVVTAPPDEVMAAAARYAAAATGVSCKADARQPGRFSLRVRGSLGSFDGTLELQPHITGGTTISVSGTAHAVAYISAGMLDRGIARAQREVGAHLDATLHIEAGHELGEEVG